MNMCSLVEPAFPLSALLPKKETGVSNFLAKYPEYDGRSVIIAIFDSGVDPNAPGLKITTDGKPKVIGRYDCSGAGDIDTSTVVRPINGEIKGLSGRTLKIPSVWKNPSGDYRIGLRSGFDILNKFIRERVDRKRKEKLWDDSQKFIHANCLKAAQELGKELELKKEGRRERKLEREELESRVDALNMLEKKYSDPGPIFDFVLYHDGKQWRAVMDTSEKGDLAACALLTEYSLDPSSYSTYSSETAFTYSFNVHDGGNILEFVACISSHGTHVASIAAAHFPDDPSKNGVAPGAQIISFTIGDCRLGTMETGTGLTRAMIHVMKSANTQKKIHIINMSYGEMAHHSNSGRVTELMNEVIDKYGVSWVVSAGNSGPALFTLSTPPYSSSNNFIGVGAFVSPEMMTAEYSMREKLPGSCYSWSSRGPTMDGDRGISVCAPGGAMTSVPNYLLKNCEMMNGTSMAAPHVSGAIALLLSGLHQQNIAYTPYFVKRALENSAYFHESYDYFAQGCGLLQVEKAYEYLIRYHTDKDCRVRFHVTCSNNGAKGILIRDNKITNSVVSVEPIFVNHDELDPQIKIDFTINLVLTCDASWIHIPKYLALANSCRSFSVRVDPTGLPTGVHATSIQAFDASNVQKGPVFQIQASVIKPMILDATQMRAKFTFSDVLFKPNMIKRHFIRVPKEVTWAAFSMNVDGASPEKSGRFVLHTIQIVPHKSARSFQTQKSFQIYDKIEDIVFQVRNDVILEVTVAKVWSSLGEMRVNYDLTFGGCRPSQTEFVMHHSEGLFAMELYPGLQTEEIQVNASLKNLVTVLKPTESTISPLSSELDLIPPSRIIFQLILTYSFHLSKGTDITISSPWLGHYLYESDYESQLWMIYDHNKKLLITGDAYPSNYTSKLEKGDYTLRHQVRHDRKDLLEKLNDTYVLLCQKLSNSISLDAFSSPTNATLGKKMKTELILGHSKVVTPVYLAPFPSDKLPKSISVGQYFQGTVSFIKDKLAKKVDLYTLKYILAESPKKASKSGDTYEKTKEEEFEEAFQDFMTNWIVKFDVNDAIAIDLYEKLKTRSGDQFMAHVALLQNLEPDSGRYLPGFQKGVPTRDHLLKVISLADKVIDAVDQTELLTFLGNKADAETESSPRTKYRFKLQTCSFVESIGRKGCAMCQYYLLYNEAGNEVEHNIEKVCLKDIDQLWLILMKFVDPLDVKATFNFALWHAVAYSHYGRLVKLLLKMNEEKSSYDLDWCLQWAFEKLNWNHCCALYRNKLLVNYPAKYRSF